MLSKAWPKPHPPPAKSGGFPTIVVAAVLCAFIVVLVVAAPPSLRAWIPLAWVSLLIGVWVFSKPRRALMIYVFLLPLEVYLSRELRITSNQICQILLLVSWALFLLIPLRREPVHFGGSASLQLLVGALIFFLALSLLWSIDLDASARSLFRHLAAIGVFWVIISTVRRPSQLEAMITSICLGATVTVVYGLLQYWRRGYDALYPLFSPFYQDLWLTRGGGFSIVATFANPNILAAFGLMVLPLIMSKVGNSHPSRRAWWLLALAGSLTVIVLTFSKSGWAILALMTFVWIGFELRLPARLLMAALAVIVLAAGVLNIDIVVQDLSHFFPNTKEASLTPRLDMWRAALSAFSHRPIAGYGLDGFETATSSLRSNVSFALARAHNTYLQTLVDSGLVGFALYFGAIVSILMVGASAFLRSGFKAERRTLLGLVVSLGSSLCFSLFDDLNGSNAYLSLVWVISGLLVAAVAIQKEKNSPMNSPESDEAASA